MLAELDHRAARFAGRRLVSIYFGGGTPSLWPAPLIAEAVARASRTFDAEAGGLEVTLEANPTDCTTDALEAWTAAGVNRLSIGVQSVDSGELVVLGRDHSMGDGRAAIERSMASGFANLSADVILGTPRGASAGISTVEAMVGLGPLHLSVYELTVEPRAPLGRAVGRGELEPLDPDRLADLYVASHDYLCERGYEHYEVSSFARPGGRAIHNSLYWRGAEYLGLGASAASFRRLDDGSGLRTDNHRSVGRYLAASAGSWAAECREQGADEVARDLIWLGMRTSDGVAERDLESRDETVAWLLDSGLAERGGGRIRPTLRGFLFADRVAERVINDSGLV